MSNGQIKVGAAPQMKKNQIFLRKSVIFYTKYLNNFRASLRSAQFSKCTHVAWNRGSTPDIDLNMCIINVIADDESKVGVYEIYFLND